jgi:cation-transporting P-type ATPase I
MIPHAAAALAAVASRLTVSQGRRHRRQWVGNGRAHIEVKGVHRPEKLNVARHLEDELAGLDGVAWAQVNTVASSVVVAFDGDRLDVDDLIDVISAVEDAHDLSGERFPHDRPDHPADPEPIYRQLYAIGADLGGIGLGLAGRVLPGQLGRLARKNPVISQAASTFSVLDSTPVVRRALEGRLGRATTDLGLAIGNAVSQGLAQGPLGLVVDIAHRSLLLDEHLARRQLWERWEPLVYGSSGGPSGPPPMAGGVADRPAPLPSGPVEKYSNGAAAAGLIGAAATLAVTRDPHLMAAATAIASPKPARLGREGFAARVDRDLARSGVLAMDSDTLRRLDRIDTVLIDTRVLTTGRTVVASVWVPPEHEPGRQAAMLAAHALLDQSAAPADGAVAEPAAAERAAPDGSAADGSAADGARAEGAEWAARSVPGRLTAGYRQAAAELRQRGAVVRALFRNGSMFGLVAIEPELDSLAGPLLDAARSVGVVAAAGRTGLGSRGAVDRVVAGGTRMTAAVRRLQAEGRAVALISANQHQALAAADLGIGVADDRPPWGAHLITRNGLADACRILEAIPAARAVSKRSTVMGAFGSGAGAVLAMAGPRPGAAARSLVAVNGAALAAMGSGFWSAMTLARRPPPVPAQAAGWHLLDVPGVLSRLATSEHGLSAGEAARRHAVEPQENGRPEPGVVRASLEELANPLTPALASGAGLAAAAGSFADAALIGTFIASTALISGVQRVSVTRALRGLIDKSAVKVRLRRQDGESLSTADQLVAGDVVLLRSGDAVPADCRILTERGLEVDETSLTGESQLILKTAGPTGAANIAERTNMLYAGSSVAAGEASAVVVATGDATELGRSTRAAAGEHRPGGVQARLGELTRLTVPVTLGAGAALIGSGLVRGRTLRDTLGTGVSLAVAAVPEGLPIVATAAQYSAARRLSRRNALVRNPGTIEALGRVDVLCFDKTGTLTEGRIRLSRVWAAGSASSPASAQPLGALSPAASQVLAVGLRATPERRNGEALAHPTDQAVADGARAVGVGVEHGARRWRQVGELPFEPSRGYHAVLGRTSDGQRLCVKGAPEIVLPLCVTERRGSKVTDFDQRARLAAVRLADKLARNGYRVLAVAERDASGRRDLREDRIERLCFSGLLALTDPVRDTAADAVRGLREAGIDVLMLTGDHPSTAEAIAAELGLLNGGKVVTGAQLDELTDAELDKLAPRTAVFARVSPEHKVRIVAALRRAGRVVAVTGDGANDAPAIRLADVGVALGLRGTNAAKEAADVVVTDDRIESIIDAIVEGRAMWSSVRDAIALLLGGNLGEIAFTLGAGLVLPGGSPLNARQLLLVNLFTDMVPSLALAMREPPTATPQMLLREGPEASLGAALTRDILIRGGLTAAAGAAAWTGARMTGITSRRASTTALVGIVGAQLGQTLAAGWRSPSVVAASLGSTAGLIAVIQTPGVSQFFGCRPLGPVGWSVGLGSAGAVSLGAPLVARLVPGAAGPSG